MKAAHVIDMFKKLWMLVRDMLLNEGRSNKQLLTVLAPVFSFTLLSDVWLCGKHEFSSIGTSPFITSREESMNGPTLGDLCLHNREDLRNPW